MSDVWSDTAVSALRQLWADGKSASQCADALAQHHRFFVSRNAVMGKARRLNLDRRKDTKPRHGYVRENNGERVIVRPGRKASYGRQVQVVKDRPLPRSRASAADIPLDQRRTLLELENHHCRFPFGDVGQPGFFFCAAPEADIVNGRPYCAFHERVTHSHFCFCSAEPAYARIVLLARISHTPKPWRLAHIHRRGWIFTITAYTREHHRFDF